MLFNTLTFSALLLGAASATTLNERFVDGLNPLTKRQQFLPGVQTATGNTCSDAFGAGYETCRESSGATNRLCYNPNAGQTCCSANWACPNGSFCLTSGYCCPSGSDAQTCADANMVKLPSDYVTPSVISTSSVPKVTSTSASINSTSYGYEYATTSSSSTKTKTKSKASSVVSYGYPSPYANNATTSAYYTTGNPKATQSAKYSAGAANLGTGLVGLVGAGVVGVAAALL